MVILVKNTNQKNHVFFMTHSFNQSEHPFGQCGHFSKVKHFENPRFLVMTTRREIQKQQFWIMKKKTKIH